jgi:hypothetical protein
MRAKHTGNGKKILLIDGKSETSLPAALEQEGCDITVCESPQKAWGFVYPIRPDVIILHLQHLSSKDIYALQGSSPNFPVKAEALNILFFPHQAAAS